MNHGAMLVEAEDHAAAAAALERAVRLAPRSPEAWLDLGNALRGLKRFDDAERAYRRALELDPKLLDVQFDLAVLYLDGEKPGLAAAERIERSLAFLDAFAAAGGKEPRLAQLRKDAAVQLERERRRMTREEKDRLRRAAAAAPSPAPTPGAAAGAKEEKR